jgi:hypothetical protein
LENNVALQTSEMTAEITFNKFAHRPFAGHFAVCVQ